MSLFNSKILLFGEHSVVHGGRALAIPFNNFSGSWVFKKGHLDRDLIRFADYLDHHKSLFKSIEIDAFFADLDRGMFFESDIPRGKGLGSSGALVAATFDRYKSPSRQNRTAVQLKSILGEMESYYHNKSSGFDPLVSFYNKAILVASDRVILPQLQAPDLQQSFCLIDTGVERETGPLVANYKEFYQTAQNQILLNDDYLPFVDLAIDSLNNGENTSLWNGFSGISGFQYAYLDFLIDPRSREIWKESLASDYFRVKICGAGGGGYLLCLTTDLPRLTSSYPTRTIIKISI